MDAGTIPLHTISTMTFPEAMQAVIDGCRVTKLEWGNTEHYAMLRKGLLMIRHDDGWHKWIINDGDMMGTDWIIL